MSLVGYPDFQEQAQWQSPMASTFRNTINNLQTITFPQTGPVFYNVSNWASVQIGASHPGGGLDVDLLWYDAIPFTRLLGERQWTTVGGNNQVVTVPNIGPYLQILVTNNTGSAATCDVDIAFTNRIAAPFSVPTGQPMIVYPSQVVAGGANITQTATYLYGGAALFTVNTDGNEGWVAVIEAQNSAGAITEVAHLGARVAALYTAMAMIQVPPLRARLRLYNLGAAAHVFVATVTPDAFR